MKLEIKSVENGYSVNIDDLDFVFVNESELLLFIFAEIVDAEIIDFDSNVLKETVEKIKDKYKDLA